MGWWNLRRETFVALAVSACAATLLPGCAGGGGGGEGSNSAVSSGGASKGGGQNAQAAWNELEFKANAGQVVGVFIKSPAVELLGAEKKTADREVGTAMQTPLPIEALDAMVDDVAQKMATTLPETPEVKKSKFQLILAFATINDATGAANPRLAEALDSLRAKLSKSEKMTDNFVFVSTSENDANKLSSQISGHDTHMFRDPLQRTADTTHAVVYNPDAIFLITGALHDNKDTLHHTVQVKLDLTFTHVRSRRLIENEEFVRTYMWHPKNHSWELES